MKYKKHDLIRYLENHSNYMVSLIVPIACAALMGGYCLVARQDPVYFVLFLALGTGFFVSGVVESVPLLMMDRAYPGSLQEGQKECPPVKAATKRTLQRMALGTAFLLIAASIALWMEFPYL